MHDNAKNTEYKGARFIMLEVKVTPFCKDYGFQLALVTKVLPSSQITTTLMNLSVHRTAPRPTMFVRKSSLSVVSCDD
jgi:hypothetical protein